MMGLSLLACLAFVALFSLAQTAAALDVTSPTVSFTVPANGVTGVAINRKISATFSEAMDPLTINNATLYA